ncbi:MAG TPA: YoaK family protein [Candidatus Acidoferrum sp.]|nr:YoaK family protein [Candidatus Acidoferrum sp.]
MAVALVLTISSGIVDVVGFLGVFNLFAAHLTGTTVHLGQGIVFREPEQVIAAFLIVVAFFLGSVVGRALIEAGARWRFRRIAGVTLAIEATMLAIVVASISTKMAGARPAPPGTYFYLALVAGAMGMQTATLTRVGPLTVHTTFVTGMINKLAQLVSRILFRGYDFLRGRDTIEKRAEQRAESRHAIFIFSIWVCYVLGAVAGSASYLRWGIQALFVAVAGLAVSIVTDLFAPLSVAEEREQSER